MDRGTRLDRNQPVIVLNDDAESGQTVGYYGTIDRVLSQSIIRYPNDPMRWRYFVHVPYLRGRVNAPRRQLYATDAPSDKNQTADIEWKLEFDTPPIEGSEEIFGSYQIPELNCTHFVFQKSDVQNPTYKFAKAISDGNDTSRLHYFVPRNVRLTAEFVLRAIRDLIGYAPSPESDSNVTKA